ncbi:peptidoglycan-binding protein [Virgibacillus sp. YIM 98842]|uniref:peptidoglycan-binding protein n=1 Tax=Virgibacillus sp. YIM 98842 TaxID=2663533 RepID=UPI0013D95F1F|nr:peptidoglycan-binding protein [Virgibacillus sp. YIM 98842]
MKVIKQLFILMAALILFHFSPQITEAAEHNRDNSSEIETTKEADSESKTSSIDEEKKLEEDLKEPVENKETSDNKENYNQTVESDGNPKNEQEKDKIIKENPKEKDENTEEKDEEKTQENHKSSKPRSEEVENEEEETSESSTSIMQFRDSGEAVQAFKLDLMELGFGTHWNNPTNYFGPDTVNVVEEFQSYYGITVSGTGDEATLSKVESVLSSPYQRGNRSEEIREIKLDLVALGFADWSNPTNYFGPDTENVVRAFQSANGLAVNGIIDEVTFNKLDELLNAPLQYGDRNPRVQEFKLNLMQLGFGTHWNNPTNYFGPDTVNVVEEFQSYYGLTVNGTGDDPTLSKMATIFSSPYQRGNRSEEIREIKLDLVALGFADWSNPTNYFGSDTENVVKDFQSTFNLAVNGIIDEITYNKIEELKATPLQYGVRSTEVKEFKLDLVKLGFADWANPTTYFGSGTVSAVEDFQDFYGLPITGTGDEATLDQIETILSTPMQLGARSNEIRQMKEELVAIGFAEWSSPSNYFGAETENAVKDFQSAYSLAVNGIVDEVTLAKIEEVKNAPLEYGLRRGDVIDFKEDLMNTGFGTHWNNPTNYFGPDTVNVVEEFQAYYGLAVTGKGDEATLDQIESVLSSPYQAGNRSEEILNLKLDMVDLGFAHWSNPTNYYGSETEAVVREIQEHYNLAINGIVDEVTLNRLEEETSDLLRYGQRSDEVQSFKENLIKTGFGTHWNNPTNYFGPDTVTVVEEFQSFYGLAVSGVANEFTLNKVDEILSSPMQLGARSSEIRQMKEDLVALGFADWSNPTNCFCADTERVVKEFQAEHNLPVSGIMDQVSINKLNSEIENNVFRIFLDPGHGDDDPGGQGYGLNEKDVVLDIALKTADVLLSTYTGVDVRLSRIDDTFVELTDRANMANEWDADYFVSFHTNAFNGNARGFETYIYNGNVSDETRERQKDIHDYLADRIDVNDRGAKEANFNVLRNTSMPAILLEYMFIDNYNENQLLRDASYRTFLAQITAEAIANSFNLRTR